MLNLYILYLGAVIQQLWGYLRDTYRKIRLNYVRDNTLSSGSGAREKAAPTWKFYNDMEFVNDTLTKRNTISNDLVAGYNIYY